MKDVPDAVLVIDLKKEQLAIREARRLKIPVVALVDTNCDPDDADFVIPGNDDAISSCSLVVRAIADGVEAGRKLVTEQEMARKQQQAAEAEAAAQARAAAEAAAAEQAAAESEAAPAEPAAATEEAPAPTEAPATEETREVKAE
jgi:small subunit ribosomal protein S2